MFYVIEKINNKTIYFNILVLTKNFWDYFKSWTVDSKNTLRTCK